MKTLRQWWLWLMIVAALLWAAFLELLGAA